MAKVAVVTRTKNRPLLLERTILSVINQSFSDWEHIIVNDAGEKDCVQRLIEKYSEQYGSRVKVIHNAESKGMERASNIGVLNSSSDYVVILDDDDSWDETFLEKSINVLKKENASGVVSYCNYVIEKVEDDNAVRILHKYPFNDDIDEMGLSSVILNKVYPPPVSFVFERKCYEALGGFNEEFLKAGDIEFFLGFLRKYKMSIIPEALANYHARPYNQGVQANSTQKDNSYWERKLAKHLFRKDFILGCLYFILNKIKPIRDFFVIKKRLKQYKSKKIALYGAGIRAQELIPFFKSYDVVGVLDSSKEKQGSSICNLKISSPEDISSLRPEVIVLSVANTSMVKPYVLDLLQKNNLDCEIVSLV